MFDTSRRRPLADGCRRHAGPGGRDLQRPSVWPPSRATPSPPTSSRSGLAELRSEIAEVRPEIAEVRTRWPASTPAPRRRSPRHAPSSGRSLAEVRTGIASLDTRISTQIAEARAEQRTQLPEVRTGIASLDTRPIRWTVGTVIATATLTVAILRLLGQAVCAVERRGRPQAWPGPGLNRQATLSGPEPQDGRRGGGHAPSRWRSATSYVRSPHTSRPSPEVARSVTVALARSSRRSNALVGLPRA